MSKDNEKTEIILKRDIEIIELDERLDMSVDPYIILFDGTNVVCPNVNCSGGNCVAQCACPPDPIDPVES